MININLIAERRARQLHEINLRRWALLGLGLLVLAMLSLNLAQWRESNVAQMRVAQVQSDLKDLHVKEAELQKLLDEIATKRPVVELLRQVRISESAWMIILADLSRTIPNDVVINSINTTAGKDGVVLRIIGKARDEKTVGSFWLALRQETGWAKLPRLARIATEENQELGASYVRFDFSVPVNGLLGGDL